MEDSRKGKRDEEKGLSTPNPHVDGGNGKKAIVYNTKEEKKEWRRKKKKNKKNIRERKRDNNKNGVLSNHSTRACSRILFVQIYAHNSFLLTL